MERAVCRSAAWGYFSRSVILPWALDARQPTGRVLETGGGGGAMAVGLLARFGDIALTVTDTDPDMVTAARRRVASFGARVRVRVREADALDPPFRDGGFDAVVSFLMLHHVGAWEQALNEAVRVLTPAGQLAGYDLLASPPARLFHQVEGAGFRLMALSDLRRVLTGLPLNHVRVRPKLAGLVATFGATRAEA